MTTNKQLRELAEKATQGDWTTDGGVTVIAAGSDQLNNGYAISECHGPESPQNADFIAAISPATVLALLDAYEALQAECEKLRKDAQFGRTVLAKREPGKTYGCHCDLEEGMEPDGCVVDSGERHNCIHAKDILAKEQCEYWRIITTDASILKG